MQTLFDIAGIQARIFSLPGRPPFMIAADLAEVYGTTVSRINEAVSRNPERFPEDFRFILSEGEMEQLKSQNAISTKANRAFPAGFTHAGAYALSAVLKTPTAAQVSVVIHRAFAAMEAAALADARDMVVRLRTEELRRKPIRVMVVEGTRQGLDFDRIWRMGSYSRDRVAMALRECLTLGLIDRLPAGLPAVQGELFSHV